MEIRRAALADIPGVCACCVAAFKDYIPLIGQTPGPMLEDYCQARKEPSSTERRLLLFLSQSR